MSTLNQAKEMNKLSLGTIMNVFQIYGYLVRFQNRRGDLAWASVKKLLLKIDDKLRFTEWNNPCQKFYDVMKNDLHLFGDTIIDPINGKETHDHDDQSLWETHHFLLQHGRIVHMFEPSLMRLLQICYNTGQLSAQIDINQEFYTTEQKKYINQDHNDNVNIYDTRSIFTDDELKSEDVNIIKRFHVQSYIIESDFNDLDTKIRDDEIYTVVIEIIKTLHKIRNVPKKITLKKL